VFYESKTFKQNNTFFTQIPQIQICSTAKIKVL
jgi:hypothetical protein